MQTTYTQDERLLCGIYPGQPDSAKPHPTCVQRLRRPTNPKGAEQIQTNFTQRNPTQLNLS